MARPIRIESPGMWFHVTSRGNDRCLIYRDERDRSHFCELVEEAVDRFRLVLHGYVLMENHFHLIIQIQEANLSRAMQWLNVSYSVWFNRRHGRVGHLFQGRYRAIVVDPVGWGLELSRYVHLNPVRVGQLGLDKAAQQRSRMGAVTTPDPAEVRERLSRLRGYRWSSYRAYIGLASVPPWLRCDDVLELVGGRPGKAQREAYRNHVESAVRQGMPESPWEKLTAQVVLGGAAFVQALRQRHGFTGDAREQTGLRRIRPRPTLQDVIAVVERLKGENWPVFRDRYGDPGRDLVLCLGRTVCGLTLKALAEAAGGIDYVSASAAVKRFEARVKHDAALASMFEQARDSLKM